MPAATDPVSSPQRAKAFLKGKPATRLDLLSYVPLGSLSLGTNQTPDIWGPGWHETDAEEIASITSRWAVDLAHLVHSAWCRAFGSSCPRNPSHATLRVLVLPDDVGRATVIRNNGRNRSALRNILNHVDRTSLGWDGLKDEADKSVKYGPEYTEDDSLFYMFNTLPSPEPDPYAVKEPFAALAMQNVLETSMRSQGLKTELYHYQRRSTAAMIQKETQPQMRFDPRLEKVTGPANNVFYFDRSDSHIYIDGRWYQESRGGILAETMGYGKTLICFAVVLATKGQLPGIPPDQTSDVQKNKPSIGVRSLADQATAAIARHNVQWRLWFDAQRKAGFYFDRCAEHLQAHATTYTVETIRGRSRYPQTIKNTYHLCPTTLVVVPANLIQQWQWQLHQHVEKEALSTLIVDDRRVAIPDAREMHRYDLLILTGERFEEEIHPFRGNHADPDSLVLCRCSDPNQRRLCQEHPYKSPLLEVHFLRFIVDEGVRFMSSEAKTQAMYALQAIQVERKWIVSGTPARSLIGAEVELATEQSINETSRSPSIDPTAYDSPSTSQPDSAGLSRVHNTLTGRKKVADLEEEQRTIGRLGTIVKSFLRLQPWANPESDDGASWNSYFIPNKGGTRKLLSLRNVMKDIVIRHRYEDLMSDLQLPTLENRYVYLEPSFIDKLSMNLFLFSLIANVVTSERKDQDYMFNPRNRKSLELLVRNIRHSAFFWCGIEPSDIDATCKVSQNYLDKTDALVSEEDRQRLEEAISIGRVALATSSWRAFAETGEIGIFVEGFPSAAVKPWALCKRDERHRSPLLIGATGLLASQRRVEENLYKDDPLSTLDTGPPLLPSKTPKEKSKEGDGQADQSGLVADPRALPGDQSVRSMEQPVGTRLESQSKAVREPRMSGFPHPAFQELPASTNGAMHASDSDTKILPDNYDGHSMPGVGRKSILKRTKRKPDVPSAYRSLAQCKMIGTPSAKLSYLISRIIELHHSEKILVFYEGDDIAYYCAQALELLGIPHRIYASGIKKQLRNQYQELFNHDESIRVMLVDLNQAALGLHLASASRVFFVNPVWQPGLEAQAIKRAHRIGSTRDIKTETLVLKGTLEEELLHRRESMSAEEHRKASRSLLDDAPVQKILENARLYPLTTEEIESEFAQIARLQHPLQVFGQSIASAYDGEDEALSAALLAQEESETNKSSTAMPTQSGPASSQNSLEESGSSKGLKRKLVFVDELERRTASKKQKSSASPSEQANGTAEPAAESNNRKTFFADEKNLPLHTIHLFTHSEGEAV